MVLKYPISIRHSISLTTSDPSIARLSAVGLDDPHIEKCATSSNENVTQLGWPSFDRVSDLSFALAHIPENQGFVAHLPFPKPA